MKIYYILDDRNRVIPVSDWFEPYENPDYPDDRHMPEPEWLTGEIEGNAYEEHGIPLWMVEEGEIVQRDAEDVQADVDALPVPEPTETEMLRADVDFLLMMIEE